MKNYEIWRKSLSEYRRKVDMTYHAIAIKANLSEKRVARIFTGEAKTPSVDEIRGIINAMNASWEEIFGESSAVITTEDVSSLKAQISALEARIKELEADNATLSLKLDYEQKINAIYEYYNKDKITT